MKAVVSAQRDERVQCGCRRGSLRTTEMFSQRDQRRDAPSAGGGGGRRDSLC